MVDVKIKTRPIGATARLTRNGHPSVTSRTGGQVGVVTGASEEGFNPLDLMFSSLSACLALSARIAASRLGLLDRFVSVTADVTGEKSHEEPFRIERFIVSITVEGEMSDDESHAIVEMAEEICTVSNTLKTPPAISVTIG
ncbi:OsmC family protein [Neorhizobium sp. NCHU2750]|uniref:OsmC family protein n=1 Tax=Neorhizobium sp. NCHU2750 TaxID=1825976 RepID=UPI000E75BA85|nr:osmotically inducible protein OsmC [Neorhizobium sp. NCHU2750]